MFRNRSRPAGFSPGSPSGRFGRAGRIATDMPLIDLLRKKAPGSADDSCRRGHERATGGALRAEGWKELAARLGFGPDTQVRP